MAPKDMKNNETVDDTVIVRPGKVLSNAELIPDAGKVPLDPAKSWGKGIVHDLKETVFTWWLKEMTNFNQKTVAVSLLMFVSVISPTLTFGAVYGKVTNGYMGAIETILATGWVGVTYSLLGGMPLAIIGSTGPLMIMQTVLFGLSQNIGVPFLTFNVWVFIWVLIYCATSAFFDLTRYVRLATKFTDDIFALLIVSIFIMDAIGDPFSTTGLLRYFQPTHPYHASNSEVEDYDMYNVAFLSLILGLGTTYTVFMFRGFRFSSWFCNDTTRHTLADFSVILSVIIWTLIAGFFPTINLETLKVPSQFEPTFQCCDSTCESAWPQDCEGQPEPWGVRPWIVNIGDFRGKGWLPIAAAGPGILAFILVYLDNGITWHLVMHPSHKLTHGEAYNYDLLLSGCFNFINSLIGCPPLVATTVPCLIHVHSLATKDRDGKILEVQETRLTMFFSHMLVALCCLFLNALKLLPLPVLYGVFLFMGLSSLDGIQLWHRITLWFMQPAKYPTETFAFVKYMEKGRIHLFTVMQMCFFGLIFFVQNYRPIAIGFPFCVFLCIPGRLFLFPAVFEGWELLLLDGDDLDIDRWVELKENQNNLEHNIAVSQNFGSGKKMIDEESDEVASVDEEFSV